VVVIAVLAWAMHAMKWISRKGEHPIERSKVSGGIKVFSQHYSSELRNQLENHRYFSWLYRFLFRVFDAVSDFCRGVAYVIGTVAIISLEFLKSKAMAAKDKFVARRQAKTDAQASRRVSKIFVEALRDRCQNAPEQKSPAPNFAKQAEAEAAKIYQDNFAKNDPSHTSKASSKTVELTEKAPFEGSDVVDVLENFFSEPTAEEQPTDARKVLFEKFEKIDAESTASVAGFAKKCKPTTAPAVIDTRLPENQNQEVLETVEDADIIAANDAVAEIPADKISADETIASEVAPKVAAIPITETVDQVLGKAAKKIHRKEKTMEDEKIPAGVSEVSDLDRQIAIAKKENSLWTAKLAAATTQKDLAKKEAEVEIESLVRDREAAKRLRYEKDYSSKALLGAIKERKKIANEKTGLAKATRKMVIEQLRTMAITPANARQAIQAGTKMLAEAEFTDATVIE